MKHLLSVLAFVALPLSAAEAHAHLKHAEPAAGAMLKASPAQIELQFSEGVEPAFSGIEVAPQGRKRIDLPKPAGQGATLTVKLDAPLPPGTYVVRWHATSTDTHHTSGSYKFNIAP